MLPFAIGDWEAGNLGNSMLIRGAFTAEVQVLDRLDSEDRKEQALQSIIRLMDASRAFLRPTRSA